MSGMSGGSMLRTRRKDVNVKPNRRLDRKSSRGMLYENEELRLRTININAEVERGQSDIKKLKRENEQLRREVGALRGEYDRLERLLHQRERQESPDPENQEDDKTSAGSCCSECSSDCCSVQNNTNSALVGYHVAEPRERLCPDICCGGAMLSPVPEETSMPRSPLFSTEGFPMCSCQNTSSDPKTDGAVSQTYRPPTASPKEFFTAVVTVPLASHLPTTPTVSLAPVFPKSGLDILINNNCYEKFEGFINTPPIGFILPPSQTAKDEEPFQIVPNVDFVGDLAAQVPSNNSKPNISASASSCEIQSDNLSLVNSLCSNGNIMSTCSNQIVPFLQENTGFQNGGNIEDLLSEMGSSTSDGPILKDSIFVCKTKKIIQSTTVQNSSNIFVNSCRCNCRCNLNNQIPSATIIEDLSGKNPCYRTEKSIDLTYDYPKPLLVNSESDELKIPVQEPKEQESQEVITNIDSTQTTHMTTEVNSTLMMFERKQFPSRAKSKFPAFNRSNSAPVEIPSDEPIYATVKKLPKKLKRLNIKNLENEIKYIPPLENNTIEETNVINDTKTSTTQETEVKTNGVVPKMNGKSDSFSESSDKNITQISNIIPKSPTARKKKRFSIRFKRKKTKNNDGDGDQPAKADKTSEIGEKPDTGAPKSSESEKLIEASSSPGTPDTVKFKEGPPNFCKKHGRTHGHQHHHSQHNNHSPKLHREDTYPHSGVFSVHKRHPEHRHSLAPKKGSHPSRGYFKQDSYQEMTTSHSERERTNSLSSSGHSGFSLGSGKPRSVSSSRREGNIPWCGCWGNSCI